MKFTILTLFPEMFEGFLNTSIIKRAINNKLIEINLVNIRDYSTLNNHQVDDTPYGGGAGMVMRVDIVADAIRAVKTEDAKVYLMSPCGKTFDQSIATSLSHEKHIILVCGHYEGIDERILNYIDGEISIGDFILTGGEIPAMAICDAVSRLVEGVINKESLTSESFNDNMLDYPVYTRPAEYEGYMVPEVLMNGNHAMIDEWRKQAAIDKTMTHRADLANQGGKDGNSNY